MPGIFGDPTVRIIETEPIGLHKGFTVGAADVKIGQPVKLDATGKVVALAANDNAALYIGNCVQSKKVSEQVTVAMVARLVVNALSSAALNPGPVKYNGMDATTNKAKYTTLAATEEPLTVGWALTVASGALGAIEVALK